MFPKIVSWLSAAMLCMAVNVSASAAQPAALTRDGAINKALVGSPRIKAAEAGVEASVGLQEQAGLWQNPELSLLSENLGGSGSYRGMDGAETTFGLAQKIEIGGKRESRRAVAEHAAAASGFEAALVRAAVISDTAIAYANAIAAQEALTLAREQKKLASELSGEVGERVAAAREPVIQSSKAQITLATAKTALGRAEREYAHALHVLSSQWGGHDEQLTLSRDDFYQLAAPPTEETVEATLETSAEWKRLEATEGAYHAQFELEKANAVPDPTLTAGVRDYQMTDDRAFIVGISIPIPVLNQNQGNIVRARAEAARAASDSSATHLRLRNEAFEARETMENAYAQADSFDRSILPAAEKAFGLSRQGYRAGKFPYLEVLDAQRTLFAVREQRIATLNEYHVAKAQLERMMAQITEPKEHTDAR